MPFLKHLILLPDLNISDGTRNMSSFGTRFTNSRMGTDRSGYGGTSRGVSNTLVSPLPTSQRCNITTVLECIIHRLSKLSPFKTCLQRTENGLYSLNSTTGMLIDSEHRAKKLPDTATQAMRLQRETDFLKSDSFFVA